MARLRTGDVAVNIAKLPEFLSHRHVPEQASRMNGTQSDGRCRLPFQEDKMSESEFVRDLVQEGVRQAMQLEALKNIRLLINTAWFAIIVTPVVLTLILWRVW